MSRHCVCVACNEQFNSMHAYRRHRIAFRCRPIPEMRALGMAQMKNGLWVARRNAFYRMTVEAISADRSKVIPG
jgi:hypothetical protein